MVPTAALACLLLPPSLFADEVLQVRIVATRAPIRQAAALTAPVVATADNGQVFDVIEKAGEWYLVQLPSGAKGYLHQSVVEEVTEAVAPSVIPPAIILTSLVVFAGQEKGLFIRLNYYAGFSEQTKSAATWEENLYYENAAYTIDYRFKNGSSFDLSLGYNFSKTLGMEMGVDISSKNIGADYNVSIPHPILSNRPRTAQGSSGYKLTENVAFINLLLRTPEISKIGFELFGGPAYFLANCEVIKEIQINDPYPHNAITLGAVSEKIKKNVLGFNAGASMNFHLSKNIGLFVSSKYFSANADIKPSSNIPGINVSLGGFKAGGGLEIVF